MFIITIGVILNLFAFTAIGLGPSLLLLQKDKRFEVALGIAPVVGFALTAILGTWLILLEKPVLGWAFIWLATGITLSVFLCVVAIRKKSVSRIDLKLVLYYAIGLTLTVFIVIVPMIIGGLSFTNFRGNAADTFNYIALAEYLDHEPYSWAFQVDPRTLIDRHPSYQVARELLHTRWTTSAMLAWTARISSIPIYQFEYGFTLLSFILLFGPVFIFASLTGISPMQASLLAVAVCVGFWAQFVLDIRAMSQMNSISISILLSLLLARIEDNLDSKAIGERFLLAIAIIALILLYWEIVPMIALGVLIFFGTCLFGHSYPIQKVKWHFATLIVVIVGVSPILPYLGRFFLNVVVYATTSQNSWHLAYFNWFYSNPLTGLWGLASLSSDRNLGNVSFYPKILWMTVFLLSVLLTFSLVFAIIHIFRFNKKTEIPKAILLSASFSLASFIQFFFLLSRNQLWAAGKGLSFGYPFFMIVTVSFIIVIMPLCFFGFPKVLVNSFSFFVKVWIIIQCSLGIYRANLAYTGRDYKNYIEHNANYKNHDWNVTQFLEAVRKKSKPTVWISSEIYDYLGQVLGWDATLVNIDVADKDRITGYPQYLLLKKQIWKTNMIVPEIAAQNLELILIDTSMNPNYIGLSGFTNPNNIDSSPDGNLHFWMGGDATSFKVISVEPGIAIFRAKFGMGPSLPEQTSRNLVIHSTASSESIQVTVSELTEEIRVPVAEGLNKIDIQVTDKPTVLTLPNGDPRPLLLSVDQLQLGFTSE